MRQGFMINPDSEFVRNLKKRIKSNSGYCPCKMGKRPENKCPCENFRLNSECDCGLYIKDPTYIISDEYRVDREAQMEAYV